MRCIVTGGAGFIGSHLVEMLLTDSKNEVIVIDNLSSGNIKNISDFKNRIQFIHADLTNPNSIWTDVIHKSDTVFHLAALADIVPSVQNPEAYFRSNVDGTFNLLQICKERAIRKFIYTASSSCYGISKELPTSEGSTISPEYPYALTKRLGEELVLHYSKLYKIPAASLRLFNVYGPRARTSGSYGAMFGVFLAQKLAGKPFTIVGSGEQTRDFIYVTDVARAFIHAATLTEANGVYNIGSGKPVSVNQIVEMLEGPVVYIPKRPGEPDSTHADITKAKAELKWQPEVDIKRGVHALLNQINYWKEAPLWNPENIAEATKDWFKYLSPTKD